MKRIGEIRAKLAWIHTYRNLAVSAVDGRSDKLLREKSRYERAWLAELDIVRE